jgi:hypothetical protein
MFSPFFRRLYCLLSLCRLSRRDAYLAGAADIAQLECRMREVERSV